MPASPSSIITLGLGSWGSPSLVLTLGLGSAVQVGQSGVLVGYWRNVTYLETNNVRHELETRTPRLTLEVHSDNLGTH
jgi:hypothetical protein